MGEREESIIDFIKGYEGLFFKTFPESNEAPGAEVHIYKRKVLDKKHNQFYGSGVERISKFFIVF